MNKKELIQFVKKETGLTNAQAQAAVEACLKGIIEGVKKDGKVQIVGFGTFKVVEKKERTGVNPRTGEKIKIPARKTIKFTAGKNFVLFCFIKNEKGAASLPPEEGWRENCPLKNALNLKNERRREP